MTRYFIILILFLAFLLRYYHSSINPPSLYWDEVAIGYNVVSVLKTGADEYGHRLPFFFESFQDYKLPGYIYSLMPFFAAFGSSENAIRLPSHLYGTLTVLFIYLLATRFFSKKTALLSAFLFASSSWHIQFSRAGFEAVGALAFLILGLYMLHKSIDNKKFFYMGVISLTLSLSFYNGVRITVPAMFLIFMLFYWKKLSFTKRDLIPLLVLIILISPLLFKFLTKDAFIRYSYINIFSESSGLSDMATKRLEDSQNIFSWFYHNKYSVYFSLFSQNYLSHFSPNFFLLGADNNIRHFVHDKELVSLWRLTFVVIGAIFLILKRHESLKVLIPLLLFSPIAASITLPSPHALRSLPMLPVITILAAVGLNHLNKYFSRNRKILFSVIIIFIAILPTSHYLHELFFHYPIYAAREWAYGYKEVFQKIKSLQGKYKSIYVTGEYWRPYIFALYYLDYPPEEFQKHPSHSQIANFYFGYAGYDNSDPIYDYNNTEKSIDKIRAEENHLLIVSPDEKKDSDNVRFIINDLENKPMFLFISDTNIK